MDARPDLIVHWRQMTYDVRSELSAAQLEIWLAQALSNGSPIYNVGESFHLPRDLDRGRFKAALARAIDETEALHVRFSRTDRGPAQRRRQPPIWRLEERTVGPELDALQEALREELAHPIDIAGDALFRSTLFDCGHDLVWCQIFHHVAMDGFGRFLFARRVAEVYTHLVKDLEAPERSFGSFEELLAADADYRESQAALDDRAHWRADLRAIEPRPRPAAAERWSGGFLRQTEYLTPAFTEALRDVTRDAGFSLSHLLGAVAILMAALEDGSDEAAIGFVVSARTLPSLRLTPGAVSNVVPIRAAFSSGEPRRVFLQRIKGRVGFALEHQRARLEDIRRDLGLVGEGAELTPVVVNVIPFFAGLLFGEAQATPSNLSNGPVDEFSVVAYPQAAEASLRIDFNANAVRSRAELTAFRERFLRVLSSIVSDIDAPVGSLDLLGEDERGLVVEVWNATAAPPRPETPAAWFEAQAARTPDAAALVHGGTRWTYAELSARANRIARAVLDAGLGPEDRIALALGRTPDLVAAQIGVLKSGAAYLPLDPALPPARIAAVTRDAGVRLCLADTASADRLPDGLPRLVLDRDALPDDARNPAPGTGHHRLTPRHAAYVIYTSGSTGTPKGVLVEQAGVTDLIAWAHETYGAALDRVYVTTSLSFDVSVFEILAPLCRGGHVVLLDDLLALADQARLERDAPEASAIPAMISGVPSALASLLDHADLPQDLAAVVLAGEALPARLVRRLRAERPGCRVSNVYGPTEATVYATAWHASDADDPERAPPIGRPVRNMRCFVLDAALRPLPPGVAGDLYLAGIGLARGYLGQPGLSAERFLANPHGAPGERMYHTGDRARWRADGTLDYLGRSDHQVKVRGYRIEPGEIEDRLVRHPGVADAVVVPRDLGSGVPSLVAYVVARGAAPDAAALRAHVAETLPDYMVPAAFVAIAALPLGATGKLDRAALPAPQPDLADETATPIATPAERVVADLFADILRIGAVTADTNFFHKGGHSLLALRVIGGLRQRLGASLTLSAIFQSPTVAALARRCEVAPHSGFVEHERKRPRNVPVSSAQRRLWLLDRLEGSLPAYNVPLALDFAGAFDVDAMRDAIGDLVERHAPLRTVFAIHDGEPYQMVEEARQIDVPLHRVGADELDAALAVESRRAFDFARDQPFRAALFATAPDHHVLLATFHHIAVDGTSLTPFLRDLATAYESRRRRCVPSFTPLAKTYADHALDERRMGAIETDAAFWTTYLADLPHESVLPSDQTRPAVFDDRGETLDFQVPRETHRGLLRLARETGASPFMVVHAALALLLARLGAGDDLAIGTPISGRRDPALEHIVGCFANTLVLRTDAAGDPSVRTLLERVKAADLAAFDHGAEAFERVIELVNPPRSLAVHPLFQIMLIFANADPLPPLEGLSWRRRQVATRSSKFDLSVILRDHRDTALDALGMSGTLEYSTALYARETIQLFATLFLRVLSSIVSDIDAPVGSLDLLGEDERGLVVEVWNATAAPPRPETPAAWFEAQAARTPDAAALVHGGTRWTYAELSARANRIARAVLDAGLGPEDRIALALGRTPDLVAAQIGVLKSGAAYLPLDPALPPARIAAVTRDAGVRLCLADTASADRLPDGLPRLVLDRDALPDDARNPAPGTGHHRLTPRHAAYVIYTSGSTGTPKGVLVEQAGVTDLIAWAHETYGAALDRVYVTTSLSFDVSVFEILAPLCRGGHVVLLDDLLALADQARLERDAPEASAIPAMISGVPSALASLLDHADLPQDLAAVVLAGEALPARLVRRLRAERPGCRVSNVYGPTEATVYATAWHASDADDPERAPPIGRPVRNMRCFVLDAALRPLPPGVAGDLYLAGIGLARGYLGQPGLSAERFLANPHGAPGERMYHTGDRARWRADGTLDYLGRSDHQVKVRGYRIEPGEIEDRLVRHPGVADAVVVPRDLGSGVPSLVAYVVARGAAPDAAALRAHVAETLPDYMVPAAFVAIAALPLGATGKLDRAALPAPQPDLADETATPIATPAERVVADLFADILRIGAVTADTNFFHKGGDSISSLRLVALARARGYAITPRDVFRHQSVAALAAAATLVVPDADHETIPGSRLPATPIMHWFYERGGIERFCQSILLDVPCLLTPSILSAMLDTLADRFDALRLRLLDDGTLEVLPAATGRFADSISCVQDGADLAELRREAADRIDPRAGTMLQAAVVQDADGALRNLLLTLHHLAVDGVSWRILASEMARCWRVLTGETAPVEPAAVASFRLWAHRLSDRARDADILAHLAHWRDLQRRPTLKLGQQPLDPARDVVATRQIVETSLSVEETRALLEGPARLGLRVNDVFLAALLSAVRAVVGETVGGLTVDLEAHGREAIVPGLDVGQTPGWFTSLFPVHVDGPGVTDEATLRTLLGAVKERLRTVPADGISFGMLRYLNAETRDVLAAAPTPEFCFNYLGQFREGSGHWQPNADHPSLETVRDPDMALAHAVEILARIGPSEALSLEWAFAPAVIDRASVAALADAWSRSIRAILALAEGAGAQPILTPSDMPLVALSEADLETLAARTPDLETILPLTPLQEGLLFHSLYDERYRDTYIVQLVATLGGPVDDDRLRSACGALVARHPMLRAKFDTSFRDKPMQIVSRGASLNWASFSLPDDRAERAWLEADQLDRFDPSRSPLVRFRLLRMAERPVRLVITMHHLLLDGWSIPILANDLVSLYERRPLPPPASHAVFMEWLAAQDQKPALAHWATTFGNAAPLARVVEDKGAAPMAAGVTRAALSEAQTRVLSAFAASLHVTPSVVVQAAWAVLLSRLTRQDHVTFGVTVSGRPPDLAGADRIVGLLINTLPLRVRVNRHATVGDLCRSIQDEVSLLMAHPNVPLIELQRIAGQGELFDTLLVYESYPDRARYTHADGLRIERIDGRESSHYPLSLLALPGKILEFRLNYRADLFQAGVGEDLLARLTTLVAELARKPDRRVGSLVATSDEDRLSGPPAHPFEDVLIRFRRQVARRPDATAVFASGTALTFAALDRWSDHLAGELAASGTGPEKRIALLFERGEALVAAMLAVLKAGGAFVPLDPAHPTDRIRAMIALSGARSILCSPGQRDRLGDGDAMVVAERRNAGPPFRAPEPKQESAAYVLFTSGTTGLPKGVVVTRRGLASYAGWAIDAYELGEGTGAAVTTSIAFDATITSLLLPILAGEPVTLFDEARQFEELVQAAEPFSILKVTPSQIDLLNRLVPEDLLGAIARRLVIGGENLSADRLDGWRRGGTVLVNEYGPTETVVGCAAHTVLPDDPTTGSVPIGRPIAGTDLLVLDDCLQPAPIGMPGELYIAGEGLARGYQNRPDLTAERFVAAPGGAGTRMYRTGDLVMLRPDRSLLFLGRTDDQLKVRGHRIEAGEVETALRRLEGVAAALATTRTDDGQVRLVGHLVARTIPEDWRRTLAAWLPDYMVPDDLVALDAFPLTRNGKIDRAALSAPGRAAPGFVAPAGPVEETLAGLMAKLLKLERLSVDQSFFALGGDSILSIQLVSRARRAGFVLKPQQIFELQTARALAAAAVPVKTTTAVPAPLRGVDPFAATPIMDWLRRRGGPIGSYAQSMIVPTPADATFKAIEAALARLHEAHEMLRARLIVGAGGDWSFRVEPNTAFLLHRAQGTDASAIAARRLASAAELAPDKGVMLAASWFEDQACLLVCLHHLASDGVSLRIIAQDLEDLFAGRTIDVPAIGFEASARARARTADRHLPEAPFWLAQMRPAPLVRDARLDPALDVFGARAIHAIHVDETTTRGLLGPTPEAYRASLDDLLLAALAIAAHRQTGADALCVDVERHGRGDAMGDLTRTVGWFTIMHPIRLEIDAGAAAASTKRTVRRVKDMRRMVPADGAGYGLLRQLAAGNQTDMAFGEGGSAQVLFNYLGRASGGLEGFGATADPALPLAHLLSVNVLARDVGAGPVLEAEWSYAPRLLSAATVAALAGHWCDALRELVRDVSSADEAFSPSDVPLVALSQDQLDRLRRAVPDLDQVLPLAPLQEGLLFHARFEGETSTSYISQLVLELDGAIDADRMRDAAHRLVARHESLRATFLDTDDARPVQAIRRTVEPGFQVRDKSATDPAARAGAMRTLMDEDRAAGFHLDRLEPLVRFLLVRHGDTSFSLLCTFHHIAVDGWSMPTIIRELLALHADPAALLPRPVPRSDYFRWLAGQDVEAGRAAWLATLNGLAEPTRLFPDAAPARDLRTEVRRPLSRTTEDGLIAVSRAHGVTLATLMQTAWAILLGRLTRSADVVFGITVNGRVAELAGMETSVGLHINTLPLRVALNAEEPVATLARRVQASQVALLPHHHVGLAVLQRAVGLGELFDTLFAYENYPLDREALATRVGGVATTRIWGSDAAHYPLSVVVVPNVQTELRFNMRADLLPETTLAILGERYWEILDDLARSGDAAVGAIGVRHVGATHAPLPTPDPDIVSAFQRAAALSGDSTAVVDRDANLTYAELDRAANRLARDLLVGNAAVGLPVVVMLPRGARQVVAMLAVLKAGGFYIPLDEALPAARVADIVAEAKVGVAIVGTSTAGSLPAGVTAIDLEDPATATRIGARDPSPPAVMRHPLAAAYAIYTSGSTGRPKGVVVTHANVLRLFEATSAFGFGAEDRWTLFHSAAFDFSVWEIWGALLHGGRLVVVPWETSRDPARFLTLLVEEGVTVLNQTPSAFYALADAVCSVPDLAATLALRLVIFGGEALDPGRLRSWFARFGCDRPRLVNMYGITETTVHVTELALDEAPVTGSPIGLPIADLRVHLLDPTLREVPDGMVGELFVGGGGLARGYLGRPDLTAERFVADPAGSNGERLYRSGDLARRESDGSLIYVGRSDQQVKIKGFRIELGEIESRLAQVEGIVQAVVVARTMATGHRRLVAYVVPMPGHDADPARLKMALSAYLPSYMVPSAFVALSKMPLTRNGKVDRAALPAPDVVARVERAPRGERETALCALFAEVLRVPEVGVTDEFFALGGDSLLAMRLIGQMRARWNVRCSIRTLFEHPTVEGLARVLDEDAVPVDPLVGSIVLRTGGSRPALFCIHPGGGLSWVYARLARHLPTDQPIIGLQARGFADGEDLPVTIEAMAADYLAAMRRFQPRGPYHLLGWSFGGLVAQAIAALLERESEPPGLLALFDAYPVRAADQTMPLRDQDLLDDQLGMMGAAEKGPGGSLQDALLASRGALSMLRPRDIDAIVTITRNNVRMATGWLPPMLAGDMHLFVADAGLAPPFEWSERVAGTLHRHPIACRHGDMLKPAPLETICRILDPALRGHDRSQS